MKEKPSTFPEGPKRHWKPDRWRRRPSRVRGWVWSPGAFTLIELLVVIAIVAILTVLSTLSIRGISNSTDMTRTGDDIAGVVTLAAQRAASYNRQTSVRFLSQSQTNTGSYVAYQYWEQTDSGNTNSWQPVEPIRFLPSDVVISNNTNYSTFLSRSGITGTMTASSGTTWYYAQIYFAPDGSFVGATGQTSITIIPANNAPGVSGQVTGLPPNFAVVDISPQHAIATIYRPQ